MEIAVDGCVISCDRVGSGRPVVLIHGLGCSRRIWADLAGVLAADYTVVSYDMRGSGQTREVNGNTELSLTRWADDLRALLTALGVARPALVGHSLGASVAIKYASCWPQDVAALVLLGADPELSRLAPRMQRVVGLIEEHGLASFVADHWSQNPPFSAVSLERSPQILEQYRAMLLANEPASYIRTCLAIAGAETLTGRLPQIHQPALVISGAADDRTLPSAGRELADSLRGSSFVVLDAVGHTMPLEAPAEVASAIRSFLGAAAVAGSRPDNPEV